MALRAIGFRPKVVLLLVPLLLGAQLGYSYAYGHAPKFLHAWFLGSATLAVLGLIASYVLDRQLAWRDVVGVVCIVVGSYLLAR
jgi:asparagine N-glycosylation enzyme membrane subunit Stt3